MWVWFPIMILLCFPISSGATVLTGQFTEMVWYHPYTFGTLTTRWDPHNADDAWFMGRDFGEPLTADVYNAGQVDPRTITDASGFAYTGSFFLAEPGDAIIFHGVDGKYGAWTLDAIHGRYDPVNSWQLTTIDVTWYFQDDGSANFSSVPEPGTGILVAEAIVLLAWRRR